MFDLILYVEPGDEKWERYCIRLIYNYSKYYFIKQHDYAEFIIGVYYLEIDWILSQTITPKKINYIASLDCYDNINMYIDCYNCKSGWQFWVKRIYHNDNYKVIYIGCPDCGGRNTEYINCERCNSNSTPLCVMETNKINNRICKNCDIDLFNSGNIYLSVPYNSKDDVKKLGAYWDNTYKKWFIHKNNKNIDTILQKWKRLW
jgi:hypothetical protein